MTIDQISQFPEAFFITLKCKETISYLGDNSQIHVDIKINIEFGTALSDRIITEQCLFVLVPVLINLVEIPFIVLIGNKVTLDLFRI